MKLGGTTYETDISSRNYNIPDFALSLDLDKLTRLPTVPKVTPNFNKYVISLNDMEKPSS